MKAIILSSGKGKRMMPLTKDIPKPMLEIHGETLLLNKIKMLEKISIDSIFVNVAYKKEIIKQYIMSLDQDINIIDEGNEPLGTASGIRNIAQNFNDESFIVINSDVITDFNLARLKDLDLGNKLGHIVLVKTPDYLDGDFEIENNCIVKGRQYTFTGIGKYHTDLFKKYNGQDLGDILRAEKDIGFSVHDGNWMDIGTPERLEKVRQLTQGSK
jgi:MurNAc alpha-1-phosphate uridylyltransferase